MSNDVVIGIVVATALLFDFTNGFHDTANVVATSISTHAMPPRVAVAYAAIFNFAGAFISLAVAATVAKDVVNADVITPPALSPVTIDSPVPRALLRASTPDLAPRIVSGLKMTV